MGSLVGPRGNWTLDRAQVEPDTVAEEKRARGRERTMAQDRRTNSWGRDSGGACWPSARLAMAGWDASSEGSARREGRRAGDLLVLALACSRGSVGGWGTACWGRQGWQGPGRTHPSGSQSLAQGGPGDRTSLEHEGDGVSSGEYVSPRRHGPEVRGLGQNQCP